MQALSCACFMRLFPALNTLKAGQDVLFPYRIKYSKVLPLLTKLPENLVSLTPENLAMKKIRNESKNNSLFKSVRNTYADFAENTSIHGLKYTVQKQVNMCEKILWVTVVTLGIIGSVFMLSLFWQRYTSNPTRTSVETIYAPTIAIPFPTITICNINKILSDNVQAFVKKLNFHDVSEEYVNSIFPQLLAYTDQGNYSISDLKVLQSLLEKNDYSSMGKIMKRVSQSCRDMLVKCTWESKIIDCKEYFVDTFTSNGHCCSFNAYNSKNKEEFTTFFFGFQMGLTVLLNPMLQDVQYSSMYSSGMKLIIHHPRNYPGSGNTEKILAVGRETILQLEGTRYICSEEVRHLTPQQRKCVYSDEHDLRYFPEYREPNCVVECLSEYIHNTCECVPYYYSFSDKPVCNISKIPCLVGTRSAINGSVFESRKCYCPMQCEDIFYDVLSSSTMFTKIDYLTSSFLSDVNVTESSMLLHVYFSSQTQTILLRDTLTSTIYLLSSFGGIFSLFLGCSFITGAEIIYYICIRFVINLQVENKINTKFDTRKQKESKKILRSNQVWQANYKGDEIYAIYGRNVFLN